MTFPANRAVSAVFRTFGGSEPRIGGELRELSQRRGMDRREVAVFAVTMPLTVCVALGEWFTHFLHPVAAWSLSIPAAWGVFHTLPFLLGGRGETIQWRMWSLAAIVWAVFYRTTSGIAGVVACFWLGIAILTAAASIVSAWNASMKWPGWYGVTWRCLVLVAAHAGAIAAGFKWGWPWGLAGCLAIVAIASAAIFTPGAQFLGPVYRCTDSTNSILVTIDDGPAEHDTLALLDVFDRFGVKAIFFMIGDRIRQHPDLAREVIRRGHEIGNHTLTHPHPIFWSLGPWRTRREILGNQQLIQEITGFTPRWFRAPCGHRNWFTHPWAHACGMKVLAWNRRGYDAVEKNPEVVLKRILPKLAMGDIVLLHEGTPIAETVVTGVLEAATKGI